MFDHKNSESHSKATTVLANAKDDVLTKQFDRQREHYCSSTAKLMRTAYYVAKDNRPFIAYYELCCLQEANGVNLGIGLHSRYSVTGLVECISEEMCRRLCSRIKENNQKVSVLMDESTNVSRKSCLIVYLRTGWVIRKSDECFAFPLGLVELDSMTANVITKETLDLLTKWGFDDEYLKQNLVGACSDGASVMVGKNSGVLTQLKEKYPNIMLWHCMCHRIELAVGDAVKSVTQINHIKSFLDKLYSIFSQSPKANRELQVCAKTVHSELLKIGRVLGVRWVASSHRSLLAIWQSYPALVEFCTNSDTSKTSKHKAVCCGMAAVLQSTQFVHSLATLLDSLECVSLLSQELQGETTNLVTAYKILSRTIRILKNQQKGEMGDYFEKYEQCEGTFKGVVLNDKGSFLNKSAFLQALIDNLGSRLYDNLSTDSTDEFKALLTEIDILNPVKWPTTIQSPWLSGEGHLRSLCKRFNLTFSDFINAFRDYIDEPEIIPVPIQDLRLLVNTLPISSADCERGFSTMNNICTDLRNSLTVKHINDLLFISLVGPPVSEFKPDPYVKVWLRKGHRDANDTRTRRANSEKKCQRYAQLWEVFE